MRVTRAKAKRLAKRADLRVKKKRARVTQERRARRVRCAVDRDLIFARDKGVCATCTVDTERLANWLGGLQRLAIVALIGGAQGVRDRYTFGFGHVLGRHPARARALLGRLWKVRLPPGGHLWEADHVTPIAEGGSDDTSNIRTLCLRCHNGETAALKGRLARRPTKAVGRGF